MDITDRVLAQLHDENQSDRIGLADLMNHFEEDVLWLEDSDMNHVESELMNGQYAYVKFGLVLEKVRNKCMWRKCVEKFLDFRSFCQSKVNLNIWQVSNAIKSARVAVELAWLGFTDLPRNASQALKLADLSIERLGEVWGEVTKKYEAHKITALAIEQQINPDKQATSENVRLPKSVADALRRRAIAEGMSLREYLEKLSEEVDDETIETGEVAAIELNNEQLAILDRVEAQWLKPKAEIIDTFDRLMDNLVGRFIPRVRVANE